MDSMPKDESLGPTILGVTGSLVFFSVLLCMLRVWARMPRLRMTLDWDDFFIIIAVILAIIQWGFTATIVLHGYGRHMVYLSEDQLMHINKYQFLSFIPWGWVIALPKISISCLLLRLKGDTRRWKIFLFGMIILQFCTAIICMVLVLILVNPIPAMWNPKGHPNAKFLNPKTTQNGLYYLAAVNISTDLLLSLLPITFISRINQPLRTRIVISFLMALGLFTTAIAAYRTYLVWDFARRTITDLTWENSIVTIMAVLEGTLATIAACVPCLKRPFELAVSRISHLSSSGQGQSSTGRSFSHSTKQSCYKDPVLKSWHDPNDAAAAGGSCCAVESESQSDCEKVVSVAEHEVAVKVV